MLAGLLAVALSHHTDWAGAEVAQSPFARTVGELSEPGGYFDTDNLISNERSYLSVLSALDRAGVRGGAYIGVGPDQNFSYIAHIQPAVAFIVDIRRDNLLLHLLFKALFAESATRIEYLAALLGRTAPADTSAWRAASIADITASVDKSQPLGATAAADLRTRLDAQVARTGVPLSAEERTTIGRFHLAFMRDGLDLQFTSTGRAPQSYYPTYRDLLLETDAEGRQRNFLASEAAYQFVRTLQERDLVIPVTGDLSGRHALGAVARFLAARRERVSALYASNVEFYLSRSGTHARFLGNLRALPRLEQAVIIRSRFGGGGSTSEIQPIRDLVDGGPIGRAPFRRSVAPAG
jgi:hypothetical protein